MTNYAIVQTGGKQYLVKENDVIIVDKVNAEEKKKIDLDTLAFFSDDKASVEIGAPMLSKKTSAEVIAHLKGDKIRVARFKAKVRYRKVRGFRAMLSKLKILKV